VMIVRAGWIVCMGIGWTSGDTRALCAGMSYVHAAANKHQIGKEANVVSVVFLLMFMSCSSVFRKFHTSQYITIRAARDVP